MYQTSIRKQDLQFQFLSQIMELNQKSKFYQENLIPSQKNESLSNKKTTHNQQSKPGKSLLNEKCIQNISILLNEEISLESNDNIQQKQQNSTLSEVFGRQLRQCLYQINVQKSKIKRVKQEQVYADFVQNSIHKIVQLNQKATKIRQFYLYCKFLKKQSTQLQDNIQKYFQYAKKQSVLVFQLQNYLRNQFISDIIFKEYLKTYNVNIFTSDLILHYFELNKYGLLRLTSDRQFQAQRIPQLIVLEKDNVVFKQLYEISQKYTKIQNQMKQSYLKDIMEIVSKHRNVDQTCNLQSPNCSNRAKNRKQQVFQQYNQAISQKLSNLNFLINKMTLMGNNIIENIDSYQVPVLVNQYQGNFDSIAKFLKFDDKNNMNLGKLNQKYKHFLSAIFKSQHKQEQRQSLKAFFQQNLIFQQQIKDSGNTQVKTRKFEFLQQKIIRTQSLLVLNKTFSTFNMLSYLMQQIGHSQRNQLQYSFSSIDKHIQNQFRGQFITRQNQSEARIDSKKSLKNNNQSPSDKTQFNVFIETDESGNWMVLSGNKRLIYPSAINGLVQLLHYTLKVSTLMQKKCLYTEELMLQILSLKSQQICKIGQVIYNIYNLIKSKQVNCYHPLKQYLECMLKGFFQHQLEWIDNIDLSVEENEWFKNQLEQIQQTKQANKSANTRQQLNGSIEKSYLDERLRVASQITWARVTRHLTFYAQKAQKADFLSQIIYELDCSYQILPVLQQLVECEQHHYRTFYFQDSPQFYQTVLYEIIQMRNHIKLDHYYTLPRLHQIFGFFVAKALSFADILDKLATLSTGHIQLQDLLLYFKAQLRVKRVVFKGELYWLHYKNSIQNGKDKVFRQFVEEQAKNLLILSEQPMQYFLKNINQFLKRVYIFEEQVERFKYFQVISGKTAISKIKIKNIENYLNGLNRFQLKQASKFITYFNPVTFILKAESAEEQLFSDMKMSVQLNDKIRFEDISRNICLLQEKFKLAQWLFYTKCFGFELSYYDCFNIFVDQSKRSYFNSDQTLKLVINRQKTSIVRLYDEILLEDKKNIHLTISFYRRLTLVSLLQIKEQLVDDKDCQIVEELISNMSPSMDYIKQGKRMKQIWRSNQQEDSQNSEIYKLIKIKKFLLKLKASFNQDRSQFEASDCRDRSIQNICLVGKLSRYNQKRIVQKIQKIHYQIIEKESTSNKKILKQLNCLNEKVIRYFISLLAKCQGQSLSSGVGSYGLLSNQANPQIIKFSSDKSLDQILNQLQINTIKNIQGFNHTKITLSQKKQQLYFFDVLSGYKVKEDGQQILRSNSRNKELIRRNDRKIMKKGLFSPVRSVNAAQNNIMQNIQKRVGTQMIKQSMSLRKVISRLQLQDKQMRDQIAWQTSKLEHSVINKIHAFITESNIDQQQSYINFKYTVNLQTIKGMQNVIKEQTQLAIKTSEQKMKMPYTQEQLRRHQKSNKSKEQKTEQNDFFLTNPSQDQKQDQSRLGYQNSRMLNTNIQSIFNHMKKIRIFAAWKKINRNTDLTNNQWNNFNKNVADILHNQENNKKVQRINQKRNQCFKQSILCSLLKQENKILSQKIRDVKNQNINKTLQQYRHQLFCQNKKM